MSAAWRLRRRVTQLPLAATQVLKVIRYTCKLLLATALRDSSSEASIRLKEFEASIGTSRRACGLWFCCQRAVCGASFSVSVSQSF